MKSLHGLLAMLVAMCGYQALGAEEPQIIAPLKNEPRYQSQPVYALLAFGPKAEIRVWLVLDGSTLYVDHNANGDLTEAGERMGSMGSNKFGNPGFHTHFNIFEFEVAAWKGKRSSLLRLQPWIRDRGFQPTSELHKKMHKDWRANGWEIATILRKHGKEAAQIPVIFTPRPGDAQVCHLDGPLTFTLRSGEGPVLKRGPAGTNLELQIGTRGRLPKVGVPLLILQSFSPLLCTEVPPDAYPVAEIEFPGKRPGAEPVRVRIPLKERC